MPRILVADDDAVQLELRRLLLEAAGHRVDLAYSASQAIRCLQAQPADLIILDLRFPNADGAPDCREGIALIRRVRALTREMPMLVLSGWPADLDAQPEAKLVSRVMLKPVKPADLLRAVRELIAK